MRWMIAVAIVLLCIAPAGAQDADKIEEARLRAERAEAMLVLAQAELGVAQWEYHQLARLAEQRPILEKLSKAEAAMRALRRVEHTLEEREALQEDIDYILSELFYSEQNYAENMELAFYSAKYTETYSTGNVGYWLKGAETPADVKERYWAVRRLAESLSFENRLNELERDIQSRIEYEEEGGLAVLYARHEAAAVTQSAAAEALKAAEAEAEAADEKVVKAKTDKEQAERIKELQQVADDSQKAWRKRADEAELAQRDLEDIVFSLRDLEGEIDAHSMRLEYARVAREVEMQELDGIEAQTLIVVGLGYKPEPVGKVPAGARVHALLENAGGIEHLKTATNVQTLSADVVTPKVDPIVFVESCMQCIAGIETLSELDLKFDTTPTPWQCKPLRELDQLKTLRVSLPGWNDALLDELAMVPAGEALYLNLRDVGDDFGKSLGALGSWKAVYVTVSGKCNCVPSLAPMKNLVSLDLEVTGTGILSLAPLAKCASLKHLGLHGLAVTAAQLAEVSGLAIASLDLSRTSVTDQGLAAVSSMKGITSLDLSNCHLVGVESLETLSALANLKSLSFELCSGFPLWARRVLALRLPGCAQTPSPDMPRFG